MTAVRFAELRCEARLTLELETVTPLLVRSGEAGGLDPRRPDMEVVRARPPAGGGEPVPYLPGSSIKGVIRARAARILNSLLAGEDQAAVDCTEDLFGFVKGQASARSRLSVTDAYPAAGPEAPAVRLATRHQVAIDRASGAAARGALFAPEVVEQARFRCEVTVSNFAQWHLRLLGWVLLDIEEGFVTFGGSGSRGLGRMRVARSEVRLRDYRGAALADWEGRPLGLSGQPRHGGLCWEADLPDYRPLVEDDALLPAGDVRRLPHARRPGGPGGA
jgi:CRISPR-associated protein Csm3